LHDDGRPGAAIRSGSSCEVGPRGTLSQRGGLSHD